MPAFIELRRYLKQLMGIVSILVCLISWSSVAWGVSSTPAKGLKVFLARGHDAVSPHLTDPQSQKDFTDNIFKGHSVTFNVSAEDKRQFLENVSKSDIVFVNCHASSKAPYMDHIIVGSGEDVLFGEIAEAIRKGAVRSPSLVMVSGCRTIAGNVSLPTAFGIKAGTKGRVYLGWTTKIFGKAGDREFKRFLEILMKPGPDGKYPTVEQAQKLSGGSFDVIGDKSMTKMDIERRAQTSTDGTYRGNFTGAYSGVITFSIKNGRVTGTIDGSAGTDKVVGTFNGTVEPNGFMTSTLAGTLISVEGFVGKFQFGGSVNGKLFEGAASGQWNGKNAFAEPSGSWHARLQ